MQLEWLPAIPDFGSFVPSLDLQLGAAIASGIVLAMVALFLILTARFALAYRNTRGDLTDSLSITGRWTFAIVGGAFVTGFSGLASAADIVAQFTNFVASHPFTVSNVGVGALGWLGIRGSIAITADQYAGFALLIVGAVFLVQGVQDFAS